MSQHTFVAQKPNSEQSAVGLRRPRRGERWLSVPLRSAPVPTPQLSGHDLSRVPLHYGAPIGIQTSLAISATDESLQWGARAFAEHLMRSGGEPGAGAPPLASAPGLTVRTPDDPLEREADMAGDLVMRLPDPGVAGASWAEVACKHCEGPAGPARIMRSGHAGPDEALQARKLMPRAPVSPPNVARRIMALRDGQPLPSSQRSFFEPRFGHDFGRVPLHTGTFAGELARSVHTRAFTLADSVVFGLNQHSSGLQTGRQTLAHEHTHLLQQARPADALLQRQPTASPQVVDESAPESVHGPRELGHAGLIALGSVLEGGLADEAELLRRIYNQGAARIAAEELRLTAEVSGGRITRAQAARRLSDMRHRLAVDVRRTGSALNRQFAEFYDRIRGNRGRPTYDVLRARGKSDLEIIKSASKTDEFTNRLPGRMRWAGRGLWFISGGISIYVVIDAPPDQREAVAQDEIEGLIGGAAGAGMAAGICVATGVATGGVGLIVCGLVGGLLGATAAREFDLLRLLDIAPHIAPGRVGRFFVIEGEWDVTDLFIIGWVNRRVARSERIIVVSTGRVSGSQMSGRYGHYRSEEVVPANEAALALFGGTSARWVRQGLLFPVRADELVAAEDRP